jgi:hypothetical protein
MKKLENYKTGEKKEVYKGLSKSFQKVCQKVVTKLVNILKRVGEEGDL